MCGSSESVDPTLTQIEQGNINKSMWDYYQRNYKPLINKYINQSTSKNVTEAENKQVAGQINADVMKNAKVSSINPVTNQKNMLNLAEAGSSAQVSGKATSKARKIGQTMNIINIGRGQATKAMSGLDELVSTSVDSAIYDKYRELEEDAAIKNAIGSAIGGTLGALTSYAKGK